MDDVGRVRDLAGNAVLADEGGLNPHRATKGVLWPVGLGTEVAAADMGADGAAAVPAGQLRMVSTSRRPDGVKAILPVLICPFV